MVLIICMIVNSNVWSNAILFYLIILFPTELIFIGCNIFNVYFKIKQPRSVQIGHLNSCKICSVYINLICSANA